MTFRFAVFFLHKHVLENGFETRLLLESVFLDLKIKGE